MTLERERQIGRVFLILRLTLALYLMQWGIGMLAEPDSWSQMFAEDYGVDISAGWIWIPGIIELVVVGLFLFGVWRKTSYSLAFMLGFLSLAASADVLSRPYSGNHMAQLAGLPVLGALWLIFSLREFDIYSYGHRRGTRID